MVDIERWYHLALLYENPWRPTFIAMGPRPAELEDAGFVPLTPIRNPHDDKVRGAACRTMWEMQQDLNLDCAISISCYRLEASADIVAARIEPWKQRAVALGVDEIPLWSGDETEGIRRVAEAAAARRIARIERGARARGGGAAGRGRGRRGRAVVAEPVAYAHEDADDEGEDDLLALADELVMRDVDSIDEDLEDGRRDPFAFGPADAAMDEALFSGDEAAADDTDVAALLGPDSDEFSGSSSSALEDEPAVRRGPARDVLTIPVEGSDKPGKIHMFELGARKEFFAICPCDHHAPDCRRYRTSHGGRKVAQGRPLGLLAAWLHAGCQPAIADRDDHKSFQPTREQRLAGRALVKADPNADLFLAFERPRREGDDSEPEGLP